ncbi:MAG: CsbD family protein [Acidobacteriota bacterium]|nr:CsbD family protein [Acidobacteriota bacterium]
MNKEIAEGKLEQLKGQIKQLAGEKTGNHSLANSGAADRLHGAARETWGRVKESASHTIRGAVEDHEARINGLRHTVVDTANEMRQAFAEKLDHGPDQQDSHNKV